MFISPLWHQKDAIPIVQPVAYLILIFLYTFSPTPLANLRKHGQEQVRHDMCAQTKIFAYTGRMGNVWVPHTTAMCVCMYTFFAVN